MDGGSRARGQVSSAIQRRTLRVEFERLPPSGKLVWNVSGERFSQPENVLRVVLGSGLGCALHAMAMPPTVLVPLYGRVRVTDADCTRMLGRGRLFVSEAGQRLQVVAGTNALWAAIVASPTTWRHFVHETIEECSIPEPLLLPALHPAGRIVRRAVLDLIRESSFSNATDAITAALVFIALLMDMQRSGFDPLINRCPGRTLAQRRGVFVRLQRVYNFIESGTDLDIGIDGFARVANYSPCHFIRTFNAVYGRTPHAVLVEHRLRRALQLVHATDLSITEVARATGFEDRCSFARSFKRRYGRAASAFRDQEP